MIFGLRTGEILSVFPVLLSVLVSIIEDLSCDWLWVLPFLFSHVVMFWKQQRQQQQQLFKQQRVHAFETAPATAPAATASCECFSFLFSLSLSLAIHPFRVCVCTRSAHLCSLFHFDNNTCTLAHTCNRRSAWVCWFPPNSMQHTYILFQLPVEWACVCACEWYSMIFDFMLKRTWVWVSKPQRMKAHISKIINKNKTHTIEIEITHSMYVHTLMAV